MSGSLSRCSFAKANYATAWKPSCESFAHNAIGSSADCVAQLSSGDRQGAAVRLLSTFSGLAAQSYPPCQLQRKKGHGMLRKAPGIAECRVSLSGLKDPTMIH